MLLLRNKSVSGFLREIVVIRMHSKASENHSRFEVKRIKSKSLWSGVLNIYSLLNMPGKYTSDEEKAHILAWRQERVLIKVICEQSGRGKATIMRLLAAPRELPNNTVPKFGGGRRKTSQLTDTIMKQEIKKKPCLTALELQKSSPIAAATGKNPNSPASPSERFGSS